MPMKIGEDDVFEECDDGSEEVVLIRDHVTEKPGARNRCGQTGQRPSQWDMS